MFPLICRSLGMVEVETGGEDALVAAWTFEGALQRGAAVPDLVGTHTLLNSGNVFFGPGAVGQAARTDADAMGSGLYCPSSPALALPPGTAMTLAIVIRVPQKANQFLVQKGDEYQLYLTVSDGVQQLRFQVANSSATVGLDSSPRNYLVVARVSTTGVLKLLTQNLTSGEIRRAEGGPTTFATTHTSDLRLVDTTAGSNGGFIDALHLWKRLLSDDEIAVRLYNGGVPDEYPFTQSAIGLNFQTVLVAAWTFEDSLTSNTAADAIGTQTLTAAGGAVLTPGWIGQAARLRGRSASFSCPSSAALACVGLDFTLSCIFYLATKEPAILVGKGAEYRLEVQTDAFVFKVGTATLRLTSLYPTATTTYLLVARSGVNGAFSLWVKELTLPENSNDLHTRMALGAGATRSLTTDAPFTVGDSQQAPRGGYLDALHFWQRWLADEEIALCLDRNGIGAEYPFTSTATTRATRLTDKLAAAWTFEGALATGDSVMDWVSGSLLVNSGDVAFRAGAVGQAASFPTANSYLSCPSNPCLAIDYVSFTLACVFDFAQPGQQVLVSKGDVSFPEYALSIVVEEGDDATYQHFNFAVGYASAYTSYLYAPTIPGTYLVVGRASSNDGLSLLVQNLATGETATATENSFDFVSGTGAFVVGDATNAPVGGSIDALHLWKRWLTDAEVSDLYNAGAGKEYPFELASS